MDRKFIKKSTEIVIEQAIDALQIAIDNSQQGTPASEKLEYRKMAFSTELSRMKESDKLSEEQFDRLLTEVRQNLEYIAKDI